MEGKGKGATDSVVGQGRAALPSDERKPDMTRISGKRLQIARPPARATLHEPYGTRGVTGLRPSTGDQNPRLARVAHNEPPAPPRNG